MSGTGTISWRDKKSIAAPAVLLVEYPSKLRLEVMDPVGGIQALLIFNQKEFWWEDRQAKKAWTGIATESNLKKFLALPVDPVLFVMGIGGQTFAFQDFDFNENLNEVDRWKAKPNIQIYYDDYAVRFGKQYPKSVRFLVGDGPEQKVLTWEWDDWRPELPPGNKSFQIPTAAARGISLTRLQ